jgi:hypothetical protein
MGSLRAIRPIVVQSLLTLFCLSDASGADAQPCAHGEGANASILCVTLRLDGGRLAVARAEFGASLLFKQRARIAIAPATAQMREGLDALFRLFAPLYAYGLNDVEEENALADPLSQDLRTLSGPWADFLTKYRLWQQQSPERKQDGELLSAFLASAQAADVVDWGPLGYDDQGPPAPVDAGAGTLRLTVADPIGDWLGADYDIQLGGTFPHGVDKATIAGVLGPLKGGLWRPSIIRERIADFLRPRGFNPQVGISPARDMVKVITIRPVERVARTVFLPQSTADVDVDRVQYLLLPATLFHTFLDARPTVLAKVNLPPPALLVDVASLGVPAGAEPVLNAATYQTQRLELAALGWTLQLLPSQARPGSAQPYAEFHAEKSSDTSSFGADKERLNFIGGGFDYHPGQSVRPVVVYRRSRLFGPGSLNLEAGGENDNPVGSGSVLLDFVGFGSLRRRLTLQAAYGTDYAVERQFDTVVADERRTSANGRAELELVRNRNGQLLTLVAEGRRAAVSLAGAEAVDLTTFEGGAKYLVDRPGEAFSFRLAVSPLIRVGAANGASYARYGVGLAFHQLTRGTVEFDLSATAGHTTGDTPLFEWLSLGGPESVRGFRRDDVVARTLWNVQPEVWVPVPWTASATAGPGLFLRRNARIALFTDVGAAWTTLGDFSGFKAGPGLGLRVTQGPAVLKLDWARPLGTAVTSAPWGRFYFTVQVTRSF